MSATGPRLEIGVDELVVRGLSPAEARAAVAAPRGAARGLGEGWLGDHTTRVAPRAEAFRRAPVAALPASDPRTLGDVRRVAVWTTIVGGDRR